MKRKFSFFAMTSCMNPPFLTDALRGVFEGCRFLLGRENRFGHPTIAPCCVCHLRKNERFLVERKKFPHVSKHVGCSVPSLRGQYLSFSSRR